MKTWAWPVALLALLVLLRATTPLQRLELSLLDVRFLLRHKWVPPTPAPDVVVVGWNDAAFDQLPLPNDLWLRYYAAIARSALANGARAVGLDVIVRHQDPEGLAAWMPLAMANRGRLVGIAHLSEGHLTTPDLAVLAPLGVENLGLANLPLDLDGVMRRQMLQPVKHLDKERQSWPLLAPALTASEHSAQRPLIDPDWDIRKLSFVDVLKAIEENRVPPDWFAGKIVLIGSLARSDKDQVETPLSLMGEVPGPFGPVLRSQFGVMVQAQSVATLLAGGRFQSLGPVPNLAVLLLLCLPTAWLARRGSARGPVLIWLAYAVFNLLLFVCGRVWLDLALPLLALPLVAGLAYYLRQSDEAEARRLLRATISRYVSEEVMEEMLADPAAHLKNLTQQREITVLFSDINDFSTACEEEAPEDVARWLDEHYREMCQVIFGERGTVVRFVGDQFMVLFGAPRAHPQPERAAVRTALAMVERLAQLESLGQRGFYRVKVGVHTGKMLLATLGDAEKSEYTAIGDAANLAARIQDLCKRLGVPVLLSQTTRERAGAIEGIEYRDMDEHEVKGRHSKVRVFTVTRA